MPFFCFSAYKEAPHLCFTHLDERLPLPLTEPEKRLVNILDLIQIETQVPVSAKRQWLGRPTKEREAIARTFIAKAVAVSAYQLSMEQSY